jgi:hypothetical protein
LQRSGRVVRWASPPPPAPVTSRRPQHRAAQGGRQATHLDRPSRTPSPASGLPPGITPALRSMSHPTPGIHAHSGAIPARRGNQGASCWWRHAPGRCACSRPDLRASWLRSVAGAVTLTRPRVLPLSYLWSLIVNARVLAVLAAQPLPMPLIVFTLVGRFLWLIHHACPSSSRSRRKNSASAAGRSLLRNPFRPPSTIWPGACASGP